MSNEREQVADRETDDEAVTTRPDDAELGDLEPGLDADAEAEADDAAEQDAGPGAEQATVEPVRHAAAVTGSALRAGWRWSREHPLVLRGARSLLAVIVGLVCLFNVVPIHRVDRNLLATLVPSRAPLPQLAAKAASAQAANPAREPQIPFATVKRAAQRDPNRTGAYEVAWQGTSKNPQDAAGILLLVLPDASDAAATRREVVASSRDAKQLQQGSESVASTFTVPGLPGAQGTAYSVATAPGARSYSVVLSRGDAVAELYVQAADARFNQATAGTLARDEASLLGRRLGGFSMVGTHYPTDAVWVALGATLLGAVAVFFVPELAMSIGGRRRRAREERAMRKHRSQYLARGRKTVKGGGASPWAQQRKHR